MAEKHEKLELPEPAKQRRRVRGRSLAWLLGAGLLGCAAAYGAWMYYSVQTPSAVIENNLLMLGTQVPAQVAEVLAKKNEHVQAGQVLIRFDARAHGANAAEAKAQAASVRNLLPPPADMEDVAQRVAEAQAAEQDVVNRIMQVRTLEEDAARDVLRRAEEHAKAQLELRRLDLLSMRYSVPHAQHEQARRDEYDARQQLEKARATREECSRVRAATEGELYRIKTELAELRAASGQNRNMPGNMQRAASPPIQVSSAPTAPDIVAPADAVVTEVFAQPGVWAQPQQQLIVLRPDAGSLEATAWFPEKDGANIEPGQICRVSVLELPDKNFSGNVEQVLPAGSLAPRFPLAESAQARQIPVRIRFSVKDAESYAALKSGMRAAVRVHYVTPPWTRIGASAKKMSGKE